IKSFLKEDGAGGSKRMGDVGCGYGGMGLGIGKVCGEDEMRMLDIKNRALGLGEMNKRKNEVDNVRIIERDCLCGVNDEWFD
ncbi:methyltransferase, partial [Staphylococcus epidermidis]|uniref:methyltransferase n=1 Tax=Staphylococcus epidermidis TaxID=1282 RepID=UPI0021B2BBE1